ncbi:MAG: ABC transporter substrate-binding protein [Candidatus Omnitrophota bacterium]|nr:MAG: ABC transporter substrate-binding protein [Candidatus Omnitrophota bacterium]
MKRYTIFLLCFVLVFNRVGFCADSKAKPPNRIVSFGPLLTESLYLLGVDEKLVANTIYCTRPPAAKRKEKIGTMVDMNLEKVVVLQPDLVLATSLTPPRVIAQLKRLGVKVVSLDSPKTFDELCEKFIVVGGLVGKKEKAREMILAVKREVELLRKNASRGRRPKVFVQIGASPLFTSNKDSFINDFIEFAGGSNIAKYSRGGIYSREAVLRQNPDVIIIATMGMVAEEEKEIWKSFRGLAAANNNSIYIVESDQVCSPTPFTFADTLRKFIKMIKGEYE